jgi:hypothetical protein
MNFKYWKSKLSLFVIIAGFIFNTYWIWGILFLIWAINDLRTGYTYLMDEISRWEAPVLYWTIVLMWLFFAITSFFPNYIFSSNSNQIRQNTEYLSNKRTDIPQAANTDTSKLASISRKSSTIGDIPDLSQELVDEDYHYKLNIPSNWKVKTEYDDEMQYLSISDEDELVNITLISFYSKWRLSTSDIEKEIEKETSKEMPYFDFKSKQKISISPVDNFSQEDFLSYRLLGEYKDVDIVGLTCYKSNNKFGYNLIAVFPDNDNYSEDLVHSIIKKLVFFQDK